MRAAGVGGVLRGVSLMPGEWEWLAWFVLLVWCFTALVSTVVLL